MALTLLTVFKQLQSAEKPLFLLSPVTQSWLEIPWHSSFAPCCVSASKHGQRECPFCPLPAPTHSWALPSSQGMNLMQWLSEAWCSLSRNSWWKRQEIMLLDKNWSANKCGREMVFFFFINTGLRNMFLNEEVYL